jgi:hypothetical protein
MERELSKIINEQGWTPETVLLLALDFIRENHSAEFVEFCREAAKSDPDELTAREMEDLLVATLGDKTPSLEEIEVWTPEQKRDVEDWCMCFLMHKQGETLELPPPPPELGIVL